jgi:hypothetical protein
VSAFVLLLFFLNTTFYDKSFVEHVSRV